MRARLPRSATAASAAAGGPRKKRKGAPPQVCACAHVHEGWGMKEKKREAILPTDLLIDDFSQPAWARPGGVEATTNSSCQNPKHNVTSIMSKIMMIVRKGISC